MAARVVPGAAARWVVLLALGAQPPRGKAMLVEQALSAGTSTVAAVAVRAARAVVGVGAVVADAAAVVSVAQLAAVVVTPLKVL